MIHYDKTSERLKFLVFIARSSLLFIQRVCCMLWSLPYMLFNKWQLKAFVSSCLRIFLNPWVIRAFIRMTYKLQVFGQLSWRSRKYSGIIVVNEYIIIKQNIQEKGNNKLTKR